MLTYTTIFIASLIVAVVGLVLYRVIMASSESVLNSKGPVSLTSSTTSPPTGGSDYVVANAPAFPDKSSHLASANVSGPSPTGNADLDLQTDWNQVREQHPHHSTGAAGNEHCSLFDVDPTAPPAKRDVTWPHREEKHETGGSAYRVTRKAAPQAASPEDSGKPWGW